MNNTITLSTTRTARISKEAFASTRIAFSIRSNRDVKAHGFYFPKNGTMIHSGIAADVELSEIKSFIQSI
jgi:hypothetical protein